MSFAEDLKRLRSSPARERRVLLIDDQVDAMIPLNTLLNHLGISVSLVFDGFTAKRAMESRAFDLVMIDWNMPQLNGGECLAYADAAISRGDIRREPVPFVVYSGRRADSIQVPLLTNFRQVAHWRKPMALSELTRRLTALLERIEK